MTWTVDYIDADQRIESRDTGQVDSSGLPIYEQRTVWTNPDADGARLAALTDAVDTLILDSLGGL